MPVADLRTGAPLGGTGDDFVVVRWIAEVGDHWIAPFHVHHADDEAWIVLRGALELRLGDELVRVEAEHGALARKGTPHTFRNAGDVEAEYLLVLTPRIAALIDAIHAPGADVPALFRRHASELLP